MDTRRSAAIDAVRIVGIIAVIVGHVWETQMFQRLIYSWQVPVFFVLTGYFWTTRRPFQEEARKRSLTLVRPYVFWLLVVGVLFLARSYTESGLGQIGPDIGRIALGGSYAVRPFTAFWFATALFFGALGLRVLQHLPLWGQWIAAAAMLTLAYVAPEFVKGIPIAAGTGLACVAFVLSGVAFRGVRDRVLAKGATGAALTIGGLLLAGLDITDSLSLKNADFGTPVASVIVAAAISIGLILLAESTVPALPDSAQTVITTLAVCGLMVVLTHPVILWVLSTPPTGSWAALAVAVILPWAAGLVVLHTRLAPWVLGVPRRQFSQRGLADRTT